MSSLLKPEELKRLVELGRRLPYEEPSLREVEELRGQLLISAAATQQRRPSRVWWALAGLPAGASAVRGASGLLPPRPGAPLSVACGAGGVTACSLNSRPDPGAVAAFDDPLVAAVAAVLVGAGASRPQNA